MEYIKQLRVKHYIKNLLIFLPIFFNWLDSAKLSCEQFTSCLWAFLAFSATCSFVYILNDLKDIDKDRAHPKKKNRPLASGRISKKQAYLMMAILAIFAGIFSYTASDSKAAYILLLGYAAINILYSFGLKNIPIIDILILSLGFFLRVLYGSLITGIEISSWLYLTVFSGSIYLALGKRRNELRAGTNTREVLNAYSKEFLDKNMHVYLALTLAFYSLWAVSCGYYLTIPIIMLIFMKYSLNIEGEASGGDPVEILTKDFGLISLCILLIFTFMGGDMSELLRL